MVFPHNTDKCQTAPFRIIAGGKSLLQAKCERDKEPSINNKWRGFWLAVAKGEIQAAVWEIEHG